MDSKPVFYDPKGRRGTFVTRFGAFFGTVAAVLSTLVLLAAAFTIPYLPAIRQGGKPTALPLPRRSNKLPNFLTADYRRRLALEISQEQKRLKTTPIVGST